MSLLPRVAIALAEALRSFSLCVFSIAITIALLRSLNNNGCLYYDKHISPEFIQTKEGELKITPLASLCVLIFPFIVI